MGNASISTGLGDDPELRDTHINEAEEVEDGDSRNDVKINLHAQFGFSLWVECDERSALHDKKDETQRCVS
jgi:hypothetical protein